MIRRGFLGSLVTAAFLPFVWIPNTPKKHGREVGRKGINGLEMIKWEDIQEGDDIVAMDWTAGHLSAVLQFGVAQGPPVLDLPGHPVPFNSQHDPDASLFGRRSKQKTGPIFDVIDCVKP